MSSATQPSDSTPVAIGETADSMEALFGALSDPTRRRMLELLVDGEQSVSTLVASLQAERRLSQPAVSQHLRILKRAGLVTVRAQGTHRLYRLQVPGLSAAAGWLNRLVDDVAARQQPFDALDTELARGRRAASQGGRSASQGGRESSSRSSATA